MPCKFWRLFTLSTAALAVGASSVFAQVQGPSTSRTPYVVPTTGGVVTKSIFTVGTLDRDGTTGAPDGNADVVTLDTVNLKSVANGDPVAVAGQPYVMVGIPDGLGAYDNNDGTFTVLMNHELGSTAGITRAHGGIGSFVSKYTVNKATLAVTNGQDLIRNVQVWNGTSYQASPTEAFNRFCSADLPEQTAFFNAGSGFGTQNKIFMNGEETDAGRAFGHIVDGTAAGTAYDLPRLGKLAWENSVASPFAQDKTIVMGLDDADRTFSSENGAAVPSEVYMYVGTKTNTGNDVERAGLTNGSLYAMTVGGVANENSFASGAAFQMVNIGNVENRTAAELQDFAIDGDFALDSTPAEKAAPITTQFRRVEDGHWDTGSKADDFYFVTTDQFNTAGSGNSKLWRMSFTDIANPEAGGTIDLLVDNTDGVQMLDNMTVFKGNNGKSYALLQEDVGNQTHNGKIWLYDTETDSLTLVAKHDPTRFEPAVFPFSDSLTTPRSDEESSGIIDAQSILGPGWFLLNVQAHYSGAAEGITTEMVQGGQLLAMFLPQTLIPEPSSLTLLAVGGVGLLARYRRRRA